MPKLVTTAQLRETHPDRPALPAALANRLHPHAVHLVFELVAWGEVEPDESSSLCTVVAVTESGTTVRVAHSFPDGFLDRLPGIEDLLVQHAALREAREVDAMVREVETLLREAHGVQGRLPFDHAD